MDSGNIQAELIMIGTYASVPVIVPSFSDTVRQGVGFTNSSMNCGQDFILNGMTCV